MEIKHTPTPWDDCKIAFVLHNIDALEAWMKRTSYGADELPTAWALCETNGEGARYVAIFRVDGLPTHADGQRVFDLSKIGAIAKAERR